MTASERWTGLALSLLVLIVWFAVLAERPLFEPDEGRYAEIPREMLASGEFLVPHLDGLVYLEKPPLQYWATALSLKILGRTELAARLYTTLCALGTLGAVALIAVRIFGAAAAVRATAVLASMLLFVILGQLLTLDMSLTCCLTWSLAGFLRAQHAPPAAARRWMLLAWAAAALGVLTKGIEAAAIPAAVLVLHTLITRDTRPWRRLEAPAGLALFVLIAVPWFWLVAHRVPDFLEFFFVHEHVSRYLTPSADRQEPVWFFALVFLWGTLPWTLPAVRVVFMGAARTRSGSPPAEFDARRFLWLWVLFVAVFFSFSDSKLIPYLLPALPPLALLIGALPEERLRTDLTRTALLMLGAAVLCALLGLFGPSHLAPSERNACFAALGPALLRIAPLLGVTALYALTQRRRGPLRAALFLAAGWCLAALWLGQAASAVAPIYSGIGIVRALPSVPPGVPVYSVATYDQTLPFYWNRTVALVQYRGELDYGLKRDPGAMMALAEFEIRWQAAPSAYAVMDRGTFESLGLQGLPMRELTHTVRRVLVARR
ncbi:MAG TPA: glycosyltransferase family 39 protein [Steroidobacteraceae bacterium]|nr:glycosyltransferase family 39 protein [Steroidobacteraceae bacterium]